MSPPSDAVSLPRTRLSPVSRFLYWVVGSTALGVLLVTFFGEFGSIVYVMMAFLVGLSGAIGHAVLNETQFFGRGNFVAQVFILAGAGIFLPGLWLLATGTFSDLHRRESLIFNLFLGPMLGLAVAGAFCINWIDRKGLTIGSSDRGPRLR